MEFALDSERLVADDISTIELRSRLPRVESRVQSFLARVVTAKRTL